MKKTDIAMIVLIASVSIGVAYFVANSLIGNMTEQGTKVQTIESITSSIEEPSTAIFNDDAINPAVDVQIDSAVQTSTTTDTPSTTQ